MAEHHHMPGAFLARLAVLGACACNQVFELHATRQLDAAYYDGPPEDTITCPANGDEPLFDGALHQLDAQGCQAYIPSKPWGHAVAWCADPQAGAAIRQGVIDGALANATLSPAPSGPTAPRLAGDGSLLLVRTTPTTNFELFERQSDDTWSRSLAMDLGVGVGGASQPTDPLPALRHLLVLRGTDLVELEERQGVSWQELRRQSVASLGVSRLERMSVSRDGTRLVAEGNLPGNPSVLVLYGTRDDVSAPFGTMRALTTVPPDLRFPYMTDNCSRIYFNSAGTVLYLLRR